VKAGFGKQFAFAELLVWHRPNSSHR